MPDSEPFAQLADEFERRVRQADITAGTDVILVMHCVDAAGNELPPLRRSLVPTTIVMGDGWEYSQDFIARRNLDVILQNINTLVRRASTEYMMTRHGHRQAVRIVDMDLEIQSP